MCVCVCVCVCVCTKYQRNILKGYVDRENKSLYYFHFKFSRVFFFVFFLDASPSFASDLRFGGIITWVKQYLHTVADWPGCQLAR